MPMPTTHPLRETLSTRSSLHRRIDALRGPGGKWSLLAKKIRGRSVETTWVSWGKTPGHRWRLGWRVRTTWIYIYIYLESYRSDLMLIQAAPKWGPLNFLKFTLFMCYSSICMINIAYCICTWLATPLLLQTHWCAPESSSMNKSPRVFGNPNLAWRMSSTWMFFSHLNGNPTPPKAKTINRNKGFQVSR